MALYMQKMSISLAFVLNLGDSFYDVSGRGGGVQTVDELRDCSAITERFGARPVRSDGTASMVTTINTGIAACCMASIRSCKLEITLKLIVRGRVFTTNSCGNG